MDRLQELRDKIDKIDEQIIHLLTERFQITDEIGAYKKANNLSILNSKREQEILDKITNTNVQEVYKEIFNVSKLSQGK